MPATVKTTYERAMRHPRRCFNLHHMNQCESTWVSENYVRGYKRKSDWLKPPTPWTDCQLVFKWHLNFVRCRPLGRFFRPAPLDEFNQGIMLLQKMRNFRPFPSYDMEDDCAVILDSPIWLTPFAYLHHEARLSQDWAHVNYSCTSTTVIANANMSLFDEYGGSFSSPSRGSRISGAVHRAGPAILFVVNSPWSMTNVTP